MTGENATKNVTQFPINEDYNFECSPSGRVIYMSPNLKSLLKEDLSGRNLNDFLSDNHVATLISSAANSESYKFSATILGAHLNCEMTPEDGDLIIRVTPLSPKGVPSIAENTAELLTRELNSCLGTMFMSYDTLSGAENLTDFEKYSLSVMNRGLYQMMRLSRNLLDASLYENGKLALHLQDADLNDLCTRISKEIAPICSQLGIGFSFDTAGEPIIFRFDAERIERVILNLLSNSIKYTRDGNRIKFALALRGDTALITISDKGAGVSPDMLSHIFTKHTNANASSTQSIGGAGFGFAIAKAVCTLHGGTCMASSTEGVGTTVTIAIPLNEHKSSAMTVHAPDYAGGMSHTLLELSSALPAEFYKKI